MWSNGSTNTPIWTLSSWTSNTVFATRMLVRTVIDWKDPRDWLVGGSCGVSRTDAMDWAAFGDEICSEQAVHYAAEAGNLQVLLWLNSTNRSVWTARAMDCAARGGQLEVVKWLHNNRNEGCSVAAMDWASGNGHLEVVNWLRANRSINRVSS
ncbi:hypothetical protein PHMEG_00035717 [Phytophthora megakarya]|uniref:Uncharacterized protein n=1 Tax=Phytophthora megakarya TaxID=4795 RepID=A0A225UNI1_9STRA|nr:hypothetical protein PHMEG_00035717 [Phytophthora megakarya]